MLEGLLALILLAGGKGEAASEPFRISIVVIRLRNVNEMVRACNEGTDRIHGCTHVVGEVLTTDCSEREGSWVLGARGHALALIRVVDSPAWSGVVLHELAHVDDIRVGANDIMAGASAEPYRSNEQCNAAAALLAAQFRRELQEVARASNARRH